MSLIGLIECAGCGFPLDESEAIGDAQSVNLWWHLKCLLKKFEAAR